MGRTLGFVALLLTLAIGAYIYSVQVREITPTGANDNPMASVNTVGVKNDLLAIANAERRRLGSEGKYVSLDELISSGDISAGARGRGPCTYDADIRDTTFKITATCSGQNSPPHILSISETMEFRSN